MLLMWPVRLLVLAWLLIVITRLLIVIAWLLPLAMFARRDVTPILLVMPALFVVMMFIGFTLLMGLAGGKGSRRSRDRSGNQCQGGEQTYGQTK